MRSAWLGILAFLLTAAPALAQPCKPLTRVAALPLKPLSSGHVGLSVRLNDRPSSLIFDTGGITRLLTSRVVHELGLKTTASNVRFADVAGRMTGEQVTVPMVTLGGARLPNMKFMLMPGGDAPVIDDPQVDGIVGPDFFRNADVELDFAGQTLGLFSQDHCAGQVVHWPASAVAVVPFDLNRAGDIVLKVNLDGRPVTAILDTGAPQTTMDQGVAEGRFGIDVTRPGVEMAGFLDEHRVLYRTRFKTLSIGGVTVANPAVVLMPNVIGRGRPAGTTLPEMMLGLSMLSKLHIFIAYKERKLYITAATLTVAAR